MKKIYLLILLMSFGMVFANTNANENAGNSASEGNPGFVAKLVDFNLLGQGSRFENPFQIENWLLDLEEAINFPYNKQLTYVKVAKDKSGKFNMGVRVNYPQVAIPAKATLKPVLPVPFQSQYQQRGFLDNVGLIRKIRMRVWSNIYPYQVIIILVDRNGNKVSYRLNRKLDFYAWQTLEWENSLYENRYRYNDQEKKSPVYPLSLPGVRLDSIVFEKQSDMDISVANRVEGSDFVIYISDIELVYDKEVSDDVLNKDKDKPDYIDNEEIWSIEETINKENGTYLQEAFDEYKTTLRMQRARKNLETPGINDNSEGNNDQPAPNNNQEDQPNQ